MKVRFQIHGRFKNGEQFQHGRAVNALDVDFVDDAWFHKITKFKPFMFYGEYLNPKAFAHLTMRSWAE